MTSFVPSARFAPPDQLRVKLVGAAHSQSEERQWDGASANLIAAMVEPKPGRWKIQGTAGSGVTSLVIDAIVARIKAGISPSRILVLATSKESGAQLRRELSRILPDIGYASEAPLVRSIHSFAFALVRLARTRHPESHDDAFLGRAPRLLTGAQHDVIIQELLEIHAETEDNYWPENVRQALRMVGFARQLRDFLLRAQERGLGPNQLQELGQQYDRPMWIAAGEFLQEYEEITQLSGAQLYNASELVGAALDHLRADSDFLLEQQNLIDTIVLDDAQNLDPKSAELVEMFSSSAHCAVLAGNPEHSVFHFRGANASSLINWESTSTVQLSSSRYAPHKRVHLAESFAVEYDIIADQLRRAHLIQGHPWQDMAVIVRSTSSISSLRRALLGAGVPVSLEPTNMVLANQRLVSHLLLALKAITGELTALELEELIKGPIGGSDSVTLRRLLRGLRRAEMRNGGTRRAIEVLLELVSTTTPLPVEYLDYLTDREQDILDHIQSVLAAGTTAAEAGASIELILWEVWDATGLSDRLMNASLRGGSAGSQADLDLDAVMTLFDAAGDFVERTPQVSLARFVEHIEQQELPTGTRDRRGFSRDAVAILTAHATLGRQWPFVLVAGVQEGAWPALGETGSLFGQEDLIELHDRGIDPNIITSKTADKIAEERRLFQLACSRAMQQLTVTAVLAPDNDEIDEPSRFVEELQRQPDVELLIASVTASAEEEPPLPAEAERSSFPRVLSADHIVAELRRTLESSTASDIQKHEAARQLARLAKAGIYGAHPDHWWGLAEPSELEPVLQLAPKVDISPSKIENALACPLRAALGNVGEDDETPVAMFRGTLIHAAAEAFATGAPRAQVEQAVTEAYFDNVEVPQWRQLREREEFARTLGRTLDWVTGRELIGAELKVDVTVAQLGNGIPINIRGRIDRLEKDPDGNLLVVDLKTGRTMPSQPETDEHPQLFAYQLALACGEVTQDKVQTTYEEMDPNKIGGGLLVYPASKNKAIGIKQQAPKDAEQLASFAALLPDLVASLTGPLFTAKENDNCGSCKLITACPARMEGQSLTRV